MKTTRRDFLKQVVVIGAGAVLASVGVLAPAVPRTAKVTGLANLRKKREKIMRHVKHDDHAMDALRYAAGPPPYHANCRCTVLDNFGVPTQDQQGGFLCPRNTIGKLSEHLPGTEAQLWTNLNEFEIARSF